ISFPNMVTFEYLSNRFLTTSYDKLEYKNSFGEFLKTVWDYGGADVAQHYLQKKLPSNILTKTAFRGLDLYLNSQTLNGGTDRMAKEKALINQKKEEHLNNVTKKILTPDKIFSISLGTF